MKKLHVRDIILIALIAIIFGFIYLASDGLYNAQEKEDTPRKISNLRNIKREKERKLKYKDTKDNIKYKDTKDNIKI